MTGPAVRPAGLDPAGFPMPGDRVPGAPPALRGWPDPSAPASTEPAPAEQTQLEPTSVAPAPIPVLQWVAAVGVTLAGAALLVRGLRRRAGARPAP